MKLNWHGQNVTETKSQKFFADRKLDERF